jgi:hypothetical protein
VSLSTKNILGPIFLVTLILLSACSTLSDGSSQSSGDSANFTSSAAAAAEEQEEIQPGGESQQTGEASTPSRNAEIVSFRGSVFVAASTMVPDLWQAAGWRVSDQPVDTDSADLPADCTMYPHLGVVNQWVGRCDGNVLIPKNGAEHIAVMVTDENGTNTMYQVAPDPGNNQP